MPDAGRGGQPPGAEATGGGPAPVRRAEPARQPAPGLLPYGLPDPTVLPADDAQTARESAVNSACAHGMERGPPKR
ncbi:hypothetical protein AQJ11_38685 [Streptomyces corchorusii]|uniref:Uncharacterized protein n=1 Tax=Streptomyces corchorusii TaxID=1903 RepID=A0A101PT51_STRCK|nr:hypothetical protein AQJ11_38685 [Streptomyces corchorusii]